MGKLARGRVVTLEEFIIDTFTRIEPDGSEHPVEQPDQVGGGGTYAIIGSRIFLPASRLGMVVSHTPHSLPETMRDRLLSYGEDMWAFQPTKDGRPTCRAVNRYKGTIRIFEYIVHPVLKTPLDLLGTHLIPPLPSVLHFISFPERAWKFIEDIDGLRNATATESWKPVVVWEPEPPVSIPENLDAVQRLVPHFDVVSPNHDEALCLLSISPTDSSEQSLRKAIETACRRMVAFRPKQSIVIRSGALGACYALAPRVEDKEQIQVHWVPAYWDPAEPESESKVVDPTGAGNAFMGAMCAALDEGHGVHEAVLWGTVAASFVIEQEGLPNLQPLPEGERWNGDLPSRRLEELRRRISAGTRTRTVDADTTIHPRMMT